MEALLWLMSDADTAHLARSAFPCQLSLLLQSLALKWMSGGDQCGAPFGRARPGMQEAGALKGFARHPRHVGTQMQLTHLEPHVNISAPCGAPAADEACYARPGLPIAEAPKE